MCYDDCSLFESKLNGFELLLFGVRERVYVCVCVNVCPKSHQMNYLYIFMVIHRLTHREEVLRKKRITYTQTNILTRCTYTQHLPFICY